MGSNVIELLSMWMRETFDLGEVNAWLAALNAGAMLWLMIVTTRDAGVSCCCRVLTLVRRGFCLMLSIAFATDCAASASIEERPWETHVAINALLFVVLSLGLTIRAIEARRERIAQRNSAA